MDAQTGTAVTCQCCRNQPATKKLHIFGSIGQKDFYRYLCDQCTDFAVSLQGWHLSVAPYVGVTDDQD